VANSLAAMRMST